MEFGPFNGGMDCRPAWHTSCLRSTTSTCRKRWTGARGMGSNQQNKSNRKNMKKLIATLWVAVSMAALVMSAGKVQAQGRGNFDPAQMRQDMMDRYKERMEVK